MKKVEPKAKTWRDDGLAESGGNQSAFNSGSRDKQSARENAGMKALARPLNFKLPPQQADQDPTQDVPMIPSNFPHEHE